MNRKHENLLSVSYGVSVLSAAERSLAAGKCALVLAVGLSMTACAGTKVNDVVVSPTLQQVSVAAPRTVEVQIVDAEQTAQAPAASARHPGTAEDEAQAIAGLTASLPSLLADRGLTAPQAGRMPDLILRCAVTDARSGSELKRMIIGFGAGKARLRLEVSLIDPRINQQPLLSFETVSTSGAKPGMATGVGGAVGGEDLHYVGAAVGVYKGHKQGLPLEQQQAQKEIDGQLKAYFATRGWAYPELVHTASAR